MNPKVHFKNKPVTMTVNGDLKEVTPIIYDSLTSCGVGIAYEGKGEVWGLAIPRNLIASWRATEILEHITEIRHGTLASAYYAGVRDGHSSNQHYVDEIAGLIGKKRLKEIMAMPVPEDILRAILDGQEEEDVMRPDLWPIIDEVRAGTVVWDESFRDYGLEHPDETDARRKRQDELVASFEKLLSSYARHANAKRDSSLMGYVESGVLTICEKDTELSPEVKVALAAVLGNLCSAEFALGLMPFGMKRGEGEKIMKDEREKAIRDAASWLRSRQPLLRRMSDNTDYVQMIGELFDKYFPVKEPETTVV